jgi:pimeloyl-ACP methyl ester carboxylesterase
LNKLKASPWLLSGEHLELAGFRIFTRVEGSGPWLTLLHGFPTSSWDFARVAPLLAPSRRLLALDFIGYGASAKPRDHTYTIGAQADVVEALWRHHGIAAGETAILAHDYGDTVTLELLARGAAVRGVTFLNGAIINSLNRILVIQKLLRLPGVGAVITRLVSEGRFAASFRKIFSAEHPVSDEDVHEHWELICRERGNTLYHKLVYFYTELERNVERWEGTLAKTDTPAQLVWGMGDPVSRADMVAYIREHAPKVAVHELAGIGHYPHYEVPERVAELVLSQA